MECNKEEAIRARDLAECKLKAKDYTAAHKWALKARQLYSDLENINQIVTVCEVHSSAITKVNGETDWYSILQVSTNADDLVIKKAYRKLALLLHPDKNKFAGAEAAFKLIGEANGILTDKGKRSLHDMKRNARPSHVNMRRAPSPAARASHGTGPPPAASANPTFWTACHSCGMRYQYYKSILKKALRCQNCLKPFIAYDIHEQARPFGTSNGVNLNPNLRFNPPNHGPSSDPLQNSASVHPSQSKGGPANANTSAGTRAGTTADVDQKKFERVNLGSGTKTEPGVGTQPASVQANTSNVPSVKSNKRKRQRKRKGKVVLEDEEEESESSSDDSEEEIVLPNGSNHPPRRSSRQKQNVSYNEKADDVDDDLDDYADNDFLDANENKQSMNGPSEEAEEDVIPNEEEAAHLGSDSKEIAYPDPEFFQFDKVREQTKFAVGQVWAVYDDRDGMPRYYAHIVSVRRTSPQFQVEYVWFESDPDQSALVWSRAGLPVATGKFKLGKKETTDQLLMFSHVVQCTKSSKRRISFEIYPRKGEIWALYKDWDIGWSSKSGGQKRQFKYEMVEVVSDFTHSTGFVVVPLVKLNGFVSLFMQSREAAPVVIPTSEILRFSHSVPLYRTVGNERDGVPQGAFELDPASLPPNLDSAFSSIDLDLDLNGKPKQQQSNIHFSSAHYKEEKKEQKTDEHSGDQNGDREETLSPPVSPTYECPNFEFYIFSNDRSIEKFKLGQIWALYCDIDRLPKYYAQVKQVQLKERTVNIKWLEPYVGGEIGETKRWINSGLPLGCGTFIAVGRKEDSTYDNTFSVDAFSQEVRAKQVAAGKKKIIFEIVPEVTEIWAVYCNWNPDWSIDDLTKNCQYDLVRVSKVTNNAIEVLLLTQVEGHGTVFRLDDKRKPMEIPRKELARFSHRIPRHRLTNQLGGKLSGYWELDPAALPESFIQ
ncbi:DnaJ subfamily B member 12 [Rhynchospora pubera]|uniref:DnaJ subfamily B member 12 n=1 Tax=Rhynchospora pubera TaxID=906938 RepID=A0AAV8F5X7_9POAL|nr:DnaJ subfamily B member 12 [Rhynchospora pubera]